MLCRLLLLLLRLLLLPYGGGGVCARCKCRGCGGWIDGLFGKDKRRARQLLRTSAAQMARERTIAGLGETYEDVLAQRVQLRFVEIKVDARVRRNHRDAARPVVETLDGAAVVAATARRVAIAGTAAATVAAAAPSAAAARAATWVARCGGEGVVSLRLR